MWFVFLHVHAKISVHNAACSSQIYDLLYFYCCCYYGYKCTRWYKKLLYNKHNSLFKVFFEPWKSLANCGVPNNNHFKNIIIQIWSVQLWRTRASHSNIALNSTLCIMDLLLQWNYQYTIFVYCKPMAAYSWHKRRKLKVLLKTGINNMSLFRSISWIKSVNKNYIYWGTLYSIRNRTKLLYLSISNADFQLL